VHILLSFLLFFFSLGHAKNVVVKLVSMAGDGFLLYNKEKRGSSECEEVDFEVFHFFLFALLYLLICAHPSFALPGASLLL